MKIQSQTSSVPSIDAQAEFWAQWNKINREQRINSIAERQARLVVGWIDALRSRSLRILDAGCGSGWMCERLVPFGSVTGVDLSASMFEQVRQRVPQVTFIAASFAACDLPPSSFDAIVSLGVLAHVDDQAGFFRKCWQLLKTGGYLYLTVQNRPIYERMAEVAPPSPNQIRKWLTARELRSLASRDFEVQDLLSVCPRGYSGFLRFVNSVKINSVLNTLFSEQSVEALKERLFLGCTLVLRAQKRQ